ncbi:MAG TPA: 5-dehydro-4-deoxyglucarate dehydratase [Planctomycetota bacterium]|nr:5-dehydro-4-deoxyglucarate dehydratase [Planctomycetota bacterium]
MKAEEFRARLEGMIAFPVTPFRPDLSLDLEGFRSNLQALLRRPPAALVAAGGTGELYSLTPDEHVKVVAAAVEEARGRVPVVAGVGFNASLGAEMARRAAGAGASAILALPPYYPGADEEGLLEYYAALGAATPLPLVVYSRDWVNPGPAWVERLAARVPTLAAWKDGQADPRRLQAIMSRVGARLHWIGGAGDDAVPAYYALGIRVYTSSVANLSPRLAWSLHETAAQGDFAALRRLLEDYVLPLYAFRGRRRGYEVSAMKALMDLMGLAAGPVRPPLPDVRPEERAELRALLDRWRPML